MRHPAIPNVERDASAAAIAASGLLDLARLSPREKGLRYRETAERMLATLSARYIDRRPESEGILQHAVGSRPHNSEVDVGLVYADYYFVEALLRQRGIYTTAEAVRTAQ